MTRTFEIEITYCDDTRFTHSHEEARDATEEYAETLREAIEPTAEHPEARHVRLVSMTILDELDRVVRRINSGVFPCEDRPR
jgi:plasmid stabilization system protein ParE